MLIFLLWHFNMWFFQYLFLQNTVIISLTIWECSIFFNRISRAVAALLRRLGIPYIGNESFGKIRINGVIVKKWLQPKLASSFSGKPAYLSSYQSRLGRGISHQQRNIRTGDLSLEWGAVVPLIQTRKCFSSSLRLIVALLFLDLLLTVPFCGYSKSHVRVEIFIRMELPCIACQGAERSSELAL